MADQEVNKLDCGRLRKYLQDRGVTTAAKRKSELRELAESAERIGLKTIKEDNDFDSSILVRRTVRVKDYSEPFILPHIKDIKIWFQDLRSMLAIGLNNIFVYLLDSCRWSTTKIENYKNTQGFLLFEAAHVDNVATHTFDSSTSGLQYIKATCTRQTSQKEKPYTVAAIIGNTGKIHSAFCDCPADDGGCKHVVALLFSLESFSERHCRDRSTAVGTDEKCLWDKPRKESAPVLLKDLQLGKKKTGNVLKSLKFPLSITDIRSRLHGALGGKAALSPFLDSADPVIPRSIPTVQELANKYKACQPSESFEDYLKQELKDHIKDIESLTSGQADCQDWFLHRTGRITASMAHKVAHCRAVDSDYITRQIMETTKFQSKYTDYGIQNEPVAKQLYKDAYKAEHLQAKFNECGLLLSDDYPFLGASPDLSVECACCGKGLAEIKCPYTFRAAYPSEVPLADKRHFEVVAGEATLASKSPWYSQIQMQMATKGCKFCDLVVYTEVSPFISIMRVQFDQEFYFALQNKLVDFYRKYVVPRLLNKV